MIRLRLTLVTLSVVLVAVACGDGASTAARDVVDATTISEVAFPDVATDTSTDTFIPDVATDPSTDASIPDVAADTSTGTTDTSSAEDSAVASDTTAPDTSGPTCVTLPADHPRHLVVARPYSEPSGAPTDRWAVLPLLADGTLGAAADTFPMERAGFGKVAFTADGALGFAPTDRGRIGVFALDVDGHATVIASGLDLGPYADRVIVERDRLLIVDGNWPDNGGGIYAAPLACDGTLGQPALLYATKNAADVAIRPDGAHLVAAREAIDTTFGALHLVAPGASAWRRIDSASPFDDDAILSAIAVTRDARWALVGDNQGIFDLPNRVGAIALDGDALGDVKVLSPIPDPYDFVVSPHGDAVLVVTGFDDAVRVLGYDPERDAPFVDLGQPVYVTQRPQLPADAALVGGAHPTLVFVAENQAIRRFRFDGNGKVTDLGRTAAGTDSYDAIPGALGMQP